MIRVLVFCCLTGPVFADTREAFYGTWGTGTQCARALLKDGGTVLAEPFEIRPGWLRHGQLWCRLAWFPFQHRDDGAFNSARAMCGEDSVRSFRLDLSLDGEELTLIWDESLVNGPMHRCAQS